MFTFAILAAGTALQGADFPVWTFISNNYLQIITTNILIAYTLATFVYVRSFSVKPGNVELRELAAGGQSGNMIYDWYIGRELNPRITIPLIGEIDIKVWCELRPGMMGWLILNFSSQWISQLMDLGSCLLSATWSGCHSPTLSKVDTYPSTLSL